MIIIIYSQLITIVSLWALLKYKEQLFSNVFWLVLSGTFIAFIPNFTTSLLIANGSISTLQSEILFSVTGAIVVGFLYRVLSNYKI